MKKQMIIALSLMVSILSVQAQETYENANLATQDLNGTARYVGMGGALDALGADISTISTNPAGIGLFRHSNASLSFGMVSQKDAVEFGGGNKTNMSFDQAGFVYVSRTGRQSFLNFGFNYHKSRNFDFLMFAGGNLNGSSQNRVSYNKAIDENGNDRGFAYVDRDNPNDFGTVTSDYIECSQLDYLYWNTVNFNPLITGQDAMYYYEGDNYLMQKYNKGYVGAYDFNLSGNLNDRVFLGLTLGIKDVHYRSYSNYSEYFTRNPENLGGTMVEDDREITGTGFDIKAGVIFRPIEESPFRIGLSIASPTFYELTTNNLTRMWVDDKDANPNTYESNSGLTNQESYEFKFNTPWNFGLSLGHTIDNFLALGASIDYSDYSSIDNRVNTSWDSWSGDYNSESDRDMNDHTSKTLKGVTTVKLGAELKPEPSLAVRLGFNYVSPIYKDTGVKNNMVSSNGVYYSSSMDYTNWKDTYRITAGFGYKVGSVNLDMAYQYSQTDGVFTPFYDCYDPANKPQSVDVSNKRHQLIFTLGYTF